MDYARIEIGWSDCMRTGTKLDPVRDGGFHSRRIQDGFIFSRMLPSSVGLATKQSMPRKNDRPGLRREWNPPSRTGSNFVPVSHTVTPADFNSVIVRSIKRRFR